MAWTSPIWLIALVPWAAVALWLFQGRRPPVGIPFLRLWHGPVPLRHPRRKLRRIPVAIVMALLASFLAIVAGARPVIRGIRTGAPTPLVVIVDRGLSMSARSQGRTRYEHAARALARAFDPREASRPVELVSVPGEEPIRTTLADCAARVATLPPTARDTSAAMADAIRAWEGGASGPVLVVSDRSMPPQDDRVIQIAPESRVEDVGIVALAARDEPSPQVMVRVRNQSSLATCTLELSAGPGTTRQSIDLPRRGATRDYFFSPPRIDAVVSAQIFPQDDVSANDQAWLVREGSSPHVEVRTPIPAELQRLIGAYQRSRPATDDSERLPVVGRVADLPMGAPGVIVEAAELEASATPVHVVAHPLTAHVDWEHMHAPVRVGGEPPAGWNTLVMLGGRPAVAVAPEPSRQVWVGFDAPNWSTTADSVVFWTNVVDWAGGGGRVWLSRPLNEWTAEWKATEAASGAAGWWPGLYRRSDGALRAFNAPDVSFTSPPQTDWRSRVARIGRESGGLELCNTLLLFAAGFMALAVLTWRPAARAAQVAEIHAPDVIHRPA